MKSAVSAVNVEQYTPPSAEPPPVAERSAAAPRHAAVITLAYLVATLPLAARGVWTGEPGAVTVTGVHVASALALVWVVRRRERRWPATNFLADWLPLLLVGILYGELPTLIAAVHASPIVYHDPTIQGWELALLGAQPAHVLAGALPFTALSELVHGGYVSYYALIYGPPLILYVRGRRRAFGATSLALMTTFAVCYVAFITFPVEGPRYAWSAPPGIPNGPIRDAVLWILGNGSSRGTAFPSSHAAVSTAATLAALRFQPRVGGVVAILTALLVMGAVYGGFHYAIDMVVGVAVGVVVTTAVLR
jgi:membrane-associated phospholipid phosphatase